MSYTKTTWQTGDTITAEKLNKIENGIESNTLTLTASVNYDQNYTIDSVTFDKTPEEILTAFNSGKFVSIVANCTYEGVEEIYPSRFNMDGYGQGDAGGSYYVVIGTNTSWNYTGSIINNGYILCAYDPEDLSEFTNVTIS